jgi:tetratricopeptide (TPR) repeat protein
MDAKMLIDRYEDVSLLKSDNEPSWRKLVEQYPYFTFGKMLYYTKQRLHHEVSLNDLSILKQDPLVFAQWIKIIQQENTSESTIQTVTEDLKPTLIAQEPKGEKELAVEEQVEHETEVKVLDSASEELPANGKLNQDKAEPDVYVDLMEEIRMAPKANEKSEDILQLIQDLPNTPAFGSIYEVEEESIVSSKEESVVMEGTELVKEVSVEEDNASLMVMMSFTDWLNHFKKKSEEEKQEVEEKKALKTAWQKEKLAEAADEEIDEIPEPIFTQAMNSITEESSLISEALAEILAKQGKIDKAIAMYKKLSLRNPEKSTYFANRIQEINLNSD